METTLLDKRFDQSGIIKIGYVRENRGWGSADSWEWETSIESTEEMDTMSFSGFYVKQASCEAWVGVMAYSMLTKHSAWYGRSGSNVIGGVLRHGVEIPRSATLQYKSWDTLNIEYHEHRRVFIQLGATFWSRNQ